MNYLLFTTSFVTKEEVKNYKSLTSYRYFSAGWIQKTQWKAYEKVVLIRGSVKHSYSSSLPVLRPWVIVQCDGVVLCGHCTCMAGLAETCSHVGALLHWVETAVRIRDETSSTSKKNEWLMPTPVTDVPYLRLRELKQTGVNTRVPTSEASKSVVPSEEELDSFYKELSQCSKNPVLLSLSLQHGNCFVQSCDHLPKPLQSLYEPSNLDLDYTQLLEKAKSFKQDVTLQMCSRLEELTRAQSLSSRWFKYRNGRITASRFHAVLHTKLHQPSISLLKNICYSEVSAFRSAQCDWGCSHERDALKAYKSSMQDLHSNFKVDQCGFFICQENPHLGSTPDSLVSCSCHGLGVVEVKCPYCAKDLSVSEAAKENDHFCLKTLENGTLRLKETHPYYLQCQLQLYVTGRNYCDFVVWTTQSTHSERIYRNDQLLQHSLPIAKEFFHLCILPELYGKWYTRKHTVEMLTSNSERRPVDDDDDGSWCFCRQEQGGEMVECDDKSCAIQWYHLTCLKLTAAPSGKWLCPTCHARKYHNRSKKKQ